VVTSCTLSNKIHPSGSGKYTILQIKQDSPMDSNNSTIPKNMLLNWLYSSDRHLSWDKLGKWIELNTNGKYKLVDTDAQIQSA
jgi:hypothetical protein